MGKRASNRQKCDLWDALQRRLWTACSREALSSATKGLAHDLNNLLTGVYSISDLCLRDLSPRDPMRDSLELIRENGNRAAGLVRALFQAHDAQIGKTALHDLNALAQENARLIRAATSRSIEIVCVPASEPLPVVVDEVAFRTVLLHLAANGADAIERKGAIQIRTSAIDPGSRAGSKGQSQTKILKSANRKSEIWHCGSVPAFTRTSPRQIGAATQARWVCLELRDSGPGMDPALFQKVGDPEFTTKADNGGIGLGLYLVREFVRSSGGGMSIESKPGEGTSVKLFLPMVTFADEPPPGRKAGRGTKL